MKNTLINIKKPNYSITIKKKTVTETDLNDFKERSLVKFIVFGYDNKNLTFDSSVKNNHLLRSKYPGQSNVIAPFRFIRINNGKLLSISITSEEDKSIDGYMVISKRDIRTDNPCLMRATTATVKEEAYKQMLLAIEEFCNIINNEALEVNIIYNGNETSLTFFDNNLKSIHNKIVSSLSFIDDEFDADLNNEINKVAECGNI